MAKSVPKPESPAEAGDLARATIAADPFPALATVEPVTGQPRVRPVSPVRTEGFTICVANLRNYHKTAEIAANPRVELCYTDQADDQVRLTGGAEVVTDRALLESIWKENPHLGLYLGSIDNPALLIDRIRPVHVRFMREWALYYIEVPIA